MDWLGKHNRSLDYLKAAIFLHDRNPTAKLLTEPNYFLYNHSVELALKSFLLATDHTTSEIRLAFGHGFDRLLASAVENGLPLSDEHQSFVRNLPDLGGVIDTRYFEEGTKRRPFATQLKEMATDMVCVSARKSAKLQNYVFPQWHMVEIENLRE